MTKAGALIALSALEGEDQYERLLAAVRRSPSVLDPKLAEMVEQTIEREHLSVEFLAPRASTSSPSRTRGSSVKYEWER